MGSNATRRAFSLVGMLITLLCIVVLFVIFMNALNMRVTGKGSTRQGTVRSTEEMMQLQALFQSIFAGASDFNGRFIAPSNVHPSGDITLDDTANLFSVMVMKNYTQPELLVSPNERSGYVLEYFDYNYNAYNPNEGVYWDPQFKADLHDLSHVSYAHMPLFGDRRDRNWKSNAQSTFPLLGNRGPRNGQPDPSSNTYGRNNQWAGHLTFGDGHVEFINSFTLKRLTVNVGGQRQPDNVFAMEEGARGDDAIIAFTEEMTTGGPMLQWD